MPAVASAGDTLALGGGDEGVDFAQIVLPVEKTERLLGVEVDGLSGKDKG
ncbi:hypothetical protein [Phragmitibacter flavus]|nr:hypothetical protein [Phragmitibacter flavus]